MRGGGNSKSQADVSIVSVEVSRCRIFQGAVEKEKDSKRGQFVLKRCQKEVKIYEIRRNLHRSGFKLRRMAQLKTYTPCFCLTEKTTTTKYLLLLNLGNVHNYPITLIP